MFVISSGYLFILWLGTLEGSKFYSDLRKASGEEELNFFLSVLLIIASTFIPIGFLAAFFYVLSRFQVFQFVVCHISFHAPASKENDIGKQIVPIGKQIVPIVTNRSYSQIANRSCW